MLLSSFGRSSPRSSCSFRCRVFIIQYNVASFMYHLQFDFSPYALSRRNMKLLTGRTHTCCVQFGRNNSSLPTDHDDPRHRIHQHRQHQHHHRRSQGQHKTQPSATPPTRVLLFRKVANANRKRTLRPDNPQQIYHHHHHEDNDSNNDGNNNNNDGADPFGSVCIVCILGQHIIGVHSFDPQQYSTTTTTTKIVIHCCYYYYYCYNTIPPLVSVVHGHCQ